MAIHRDNLKWAVRLGSIFLAVAVIDGLVVWFAPRPLPWAGIIPAALPLLTVVLVIIPKIRAEKR